MTRRKLATRVQLMDTQGSLPLRLGPHFYAANFRAVLSTTTCSRARQTAQEDKSHWFSNRVDNYIKTSIETSEDSNIPDLNEIRNKLLSKSWNKSCIEVGSSKTVLLKLIFVKIHSYRSRQKLWMEPPGWPVYFCWKHVFRGCPLSLAWDWSLTRREIRTKKKKDGNRGG